MGRPRRSAATGDTNSPPVLTPDAQCNSGGLDSSSSSNSQSPASSAPWSDSNRTQDGDSASPGTNIANSSSPSQSHHDFHMGDSRNSPDGGIMSSQSEVLQLLVIYLTMSNSRFDLDLPFFSLLELTHSILSPIHTFPSSLQRKNFLLIFPSIPLFSSMPSLP
jgi:hypothetical protein